MIWSQIAEGGAGAAAPGSAAAGNAGSMALLAFRRWCSGLTLSSPGPAPGADGLRILLIALAALLVLAVACQGIGTALRQLLDLPGHVGLARRATGRVWGAGQLVAAMITVTVLSWTGGLSLGFLSERSDRWKNDMALVSRSRSAGEMALEQGALAALTPLRDVAGLGDNLPILSLAVYLIFRASSGMVSPAMKKADVAAIRGGRAVEGSGWATVVWGCGSLYVLYRIVSRASGGADLPLGGCLLIEAVVVPILMIVCDGFLLAWLLTELRNAGLPGVGADEERFRPDSALRLMPAAMLGCLAALPSRYLGTLVFLSLQHLPRSVGSGAGGRAIRWLLGWGLVDVQGASLVAVGLVGVVAWGRGGLREVLRGGRRLLRAEGGHLVATTAMSAIATALLAGLAYSVLLLLPLAGWVLPAADSYSHYATLPAGLWTLAGLIELAQRSLPTARALAPEAVDDARGPGEAAPASDAIGGGPDGPLAVAAGIGV
ncbi:hypothetical protein [Aquisphaera giovannonii]|uniref:hypothetical protein n=1 Tax=Aquisphaera giovannonii TaxID=406548 RepID=UPI001AEF9748|nr:hypothetical protein [Aquisphaera giovannonii]